MYKMVDVFILILEIIYQYEFQYGKLKIGKR